MTNLPPPQTRADVWLSFTGMAYGFEAVLVDAAQSSVVLQIKSGKTSEVSAQQEFDLLQEIVASSQSLKLVEVRVFIDERSATSLSANPGFTALTSSRLPSVRRNGRTQAVELSVSEVFGISANEQSNWTRFVDRTFSRSRV